MDRHEIERLASANAKAPRVTLKEIEDSIAGVFYTSGDFLIDGAGEIAPGCDMETMKDEAKWMTICTIVLKNGFMVTGDTTPANKENYDPELGKKFSYDQAFKKLWPYFGFLLKTRQHEGW